MRDSDTRSWIAHPGGAIAWRRLILVTTLVPSTAILSPNDGARITDV
jgi:hypothetical protein